MGLFDMFKSAQPSNITSDGGRLFLTAKGGIAELKKAYKDLSDKGKFEVLIFNGLTVLRSFNHRQPARYSAAEGEFFKSLFSQAKQYGINFSNDKLINFINSRFQFYANEVENLYNSRDEGSGYMPTNIYTAFYLTPLAEDIEPSFDLFEIMQFFQGLTTMMRWVHDNANKI